MLLCTQRKTPAPLKRSCVRITALANGDVLTCACYPAKVVPFSLCCVMHA